jgi:glycosyltransferase involved in cell wall biosynthesis
VIVGSVARPNDPVSGGPANGTARLVRGLSSAGTTVTVVAPAPPEDRAGFRLHGADVVLVPHAQRLSLPRRLRPWRTAAIPIVNRLGADVVHGQGIVEGGVIAADASSTRARLVTARGNTRRDTLAERPGAGGRIRAAILDRLASSVIRSVDVTVDVHPDWRVNLPCRPRRFVHIDNIVDDVFFDVTRRPVEGRVLFCGGTRRIKGHDVLLAAWPHVLRRHPESTLRFVGWPAEASLAGTHAVETIDAVGPAQLATELSCASVVVIPSRYEVSPILLAEAWAAGTPVVATDAGGLAALAPGRARVVLPDDPEGLARAVNDALAPESADMTAGLIAAGRERAESYRGRVVVDAHLSLYRELLEER